MPEGGEFPGLVDLAFGNGSDSQPALPIDPLSSFDQNDVQQTVLKENNCVELQSFRRIVSIPAARRWFPERQRDDISTSLTFLRIPSPSVRQYRIGLATPSAKRRTPMSSGMLA